MRFPLLRTLLLVSLLLPALARAQDDDDPKSAPHSAKVLHHPTAAPDEPAKRAPAPKHAAAEPHHAAPAPHHLAVHPRVGVADPPAAPDARSVRVRLLDGTTVFGTVFAEEAGALVIDCSLGRLSIPRARISTIAYDLAVQDGSKRAPVQELDDDPPRPRRR